MVVKVCQWAEIPLFDILLCFILLCMPFSAVFPLYCIQLSSPHILVRLDSTNSF
jgi:hypothetical protein